MPRGVNGEAGSWLTLIETAIRASQSWQLAFEISEESLARHDESARAAFLAALLREAGLVPRPAFDYATAATAGSLAIGAGVASLSRSIGVTRSLPRPSAA